MSLTQVDSDFLTIKNKIISENETFLKKFQNNKDYLEFKNSSKKSLFLPTLILFLYCIIIAAAVFILYKFLPDFYVYEFIIGICLVLVGILGFIGLLIRKLKQEKSISKKGYLYSILAIETSYDKLTNYMANFDVKYASDTDKLKFYEGLYKVFSNISKKLSKSYSLKAAKVKKMKSKSLDWEWLLKYLYNFGKFCYNKKLDCKSFIKLLSI